MSTLTHTHPPTHTIYLSDLFLKSRSYTITRLMQIRPSIRYYLNFIKFVRKKPSNNPRFLHQREAFVACPEDRLLIETDSPDMLPNLGRLAANNPELLQQTGKLLRETGPQKSGLRLCTFFQKDVTWYKKYA